MSDSIWNEIERARVELRLPLNEFAPLSPEEARQTTAMVVKQFVRDPSAQWWWEHLRAPGVAARFHDGRAFSRLSSIVPPLAQHTWLLAEPEDAHAAFVGSAQAIERVLGECYAFEYYAVSPALDWLICENHHDVLTAVGDVVETRLRQLLQERPEEVAWARLA